MADSSTTMLAVLALLVTLVSCCASSSAAAMAVSKSSTKKAIVPPAPPSPSPGTGPAAAEGGPLAANTDGNGPAAPAKKTVPAPANNTGKKNVPAPANNTGKKTVPAPAPGPAAPAATTTTKFGAAPPVIAPSTAGRWDSPAVKFDAPAPTRYAGGAKSFGINMCGAEFGMSNLPGKFGTDYTFPNNPEDLRFFRKLGLTDVRFPFRWERLQPQRGGPLDAAYAAGLRSMMDAARAAGMRVILDLQNFGQYGGTGGVGGMGTLVVPGPVSAQLADLWARIAAAFGTHPALWAYELMNEPHDLPGKAPAWGKVCQECVAAIRRVDRKATIMVPGYHWQTAATWEQNNADLPDVKDPAGRLLYTAHCYFDTDMSGSYAQPEVTAATAGNWKRLAPFVAWLNRRKVQGYVTEYGAPPSAAWARLLDAFLATVAREPRLRGACAWAAGSWWPPSEHNALQCGRCAGQTQVQAIRRYPTHA